MLRSAYSEEGFSYTDLLYTPHFGAKVVGKTMYKVEGNVKDGRFSLWNVRVLPNVQNKGYGYKMICEVIQLLQKKHGCRHIYLNCRANEDVPL